MNAPELANHPLNAFVVASAEPRFESKVPSFFIGQERLQALVNSISSQTSQELIAGYKAREAELSSGAAVAAAAASNKNPDRELIESFGFSYDQFMNGNIDTADVGSVARIRSAMNGLRQMLSNPGAYETQFNQAEKRLQETEAVAAAQKEALGAVMGMGMANQMKVEPEETKVTLSVQKSDLGKTHVETGHDDLAKADKIVAHTETVKSIDDALKGVGLEKGQFDIKNINGSSPDSLAFGGKVRSGLGGLTV